MEQPEHVTLAVLAGGEGSRMGKPKGLLRIDDRPILTYLLDRFAWNGPTCLVTAPGRERPPGAEGFDRELTDPQGGLGPVRGVLTALEHLETPLLVIATVDMPGVRNSVLRRLVGALVESPALVGAMFLRTGGRGSRRAADFERAAARHEPRPPDPEALSRPSGAEADGAQGAEPFPLALRREALPVVRKYMASGRRSVHGLLANARFITVPGPVEPDVWTNLNDPADFQRFLQSPESR